MKNILFPLEDFDSKKLQAFDTGEHLSLAMAAIRTLISSPCDRETIDRLKEARAWIKAMSEIHAKGMERSELDEMRAIVAELRDALSSAHGGRVEVAPRETVALGAIRREEN